MQLSKPYLRVLKIFEAFEREIQRRQKNEKESSFFWKPNNNNEKLTKLLFVLQE